MKTSRLLQVITITAHLGLFFALAPLAKAQPTPTNILSETFEGAFPGDSWDVGDALTNGAPAYWDDVNAAFGGEGTHTDSWKGYCAGVGFGGTSASPLYQTNMDAFMSRSINLSGFVAAHLTFWFKLPGIEATYDWAEVLIDGATVWRTDSVVAVWTQVNLNLNAYVGGLHTLKFNFHSDFSNTEEGWYLDDILVTAFPGIPPNDNFANCAPLLGDEGTASGNNVNASSEAGNGEPPNNGHTVWWCWTAPGDFLACFDTLGSDFDTTLSVYTGSTLSNLTELDFNDDIASPLRHSLVNFLASAGTTYRIRVDGYGGEQRNITLRWKFLQLYKGVAFTKGTGTKATIKLPKVCIDITNNISDVGTVRFDPGESEGMEFGLTPIDFSAPATAFRLEARGNVRGMTNQLIGRSTFRHSTNSTVAASANFSAIGSTSSIVQLRDPGGAVLSSFPVANGAEIHLQPCPGAAPIQLCANTFMLMDGRPVASWKVCPAQCVLASAPGRVEELAMIWIIGDLPPPLVQDPEPALRSVASVEVSSQGFSMFTLESAALRLNGLFHHGGDTMEIRSVACDAPGTPPCRLDGSRLVRPFGHPEWVTIALNRAVSYRAALGTGGAGLNALPGTYLRLTASGNVGGVSTPLGELRLTKTMGEWSVTADYTPVGSTRQRVELYNHGMLVGRYAGHTGEVARVPTLPEGCGKGGQIPWPPPDPCYVCTWLAPQPIVIPGVGGGMATVMADELRVLAENPSAPLRYLESFTIGAVGLDTFALSNESAIPAVLAPVQIRRQPNGVLITLQTEVNRIYRFEYTTELQAGPTRPFLPPPSLWTVLRTIQGNGLMQTVLDSSVNGGIAGGGCRFYRLRALDP